MKKTIEEILLRDLNSLKIVILALKSNENLWV
jgi:hypothetical protein